MKKINISLMAMLGLAMVATSCSSDLADSTSTVGKKQVTFTATQEIAGAQTRTEIDGTDIKWVSSDEVAIFANNVKGSNGTVTPSSDRTQATITATIEGGTENDNKYVAVYPATAAASANVSGTTITGLTISDTQTATEGSYDPAAAVMTAYLDKSSATADNLAFKNVCSFIKFTTTKAYTSIVVSATTGDLAGTFSVTDAGTAPALTATTGASSVTLNPASGSTSIAAGTYYVCVAPGTVVGLKISCTNTDGTDVYAPTNTALVRNSLYDLGDLGYSVTVANGIINAGGVDHNIATLIFANVKNATTVTADNANVGLYSDATGTTSTTTVGSDGKVYVKAAAKGTSTISVGSASATVEVVNFAAKVFADEACSTAVAGSETEVYLQITDDGTNIPASDYARVSYSGLNNVTSIAETGTAGVFKVTCPSQYASAEFTVVYTYEGVNFTLFNR